MKFCLPEQATCHCKSGAFNIPVLDFYKIFPGKQGKDKAEHIPPFSDKESFCYLPPSLQNGMDSNAKGDILEMLIVMTNCW